MEEQEIDRLVESLRQRFGVTHDIETRMVEDHRSHFRSGAIRAIDGGNIERFVQNWESHAQHFRESMSQFQRTDLRNYTIGSDISFLIALGTREGGTGVFSTGDRMVVSAGRDTHREGVSGMDYLFRHARYFRQAGVRIERVSADELVQGHQNRTPARIQQGELLFAHMIKAATDERTFQHAVPTILREQHTQMDGAILLSQLNQDARRAWVALFFAGVGYGRRTIRTLITESRRDHLPCNLNDILTKRSLERDIHVVIARATALRARIIDSVNHSAL